MIETKELFTKKPLPRWISDHPIFKEVDKITKVFPGIGLPNSEGECSVDNLNKAKRSAKDLLREIKSDIEDRDNELATFGRSTPKMSKERRAKLERCSALLNEVKKNLKQTCITSDKGKITLNLQADIKVEGEDKPIFRKGESVFRVFGKLNSLLLEGKFAVLPKIDDLDVFKTFSVDNIPSNKFKVVFSADGENGIWDIATMSERGVSSCQSWDGDYRHCVIGSILDPFVGIIYLTSGGKYNERGSKMIRRCIVRFAISEKTKKPVLILDQMYPSLDNKVLMTFKDFLKKRIDDKYEILCAEKSFSAVKNTYLPLTELRQKLKTYSPNGKKTGDYDGRESIASYQDHQIKDKKGLGRDKQALLFEKNSRKKENQFVRAFTESFASSLKTIDMKQVSASAKAPVKIITGKNKNWNPQYLVNHIAEAIARSIIASIDKKAFFNSDTYIKRVYQAWLVNRSSILKAVAAQTVRKMNGAYGMNKGEKLRANQFVPLISLLLPEIDKAMKAKLNEVVERCKSKFSGPLPLP